MPGIKTDKTYKYIWYYTCSNTCPVKLYCYYIFLLECLEEQLVDIDLV